MNILYLSPDMSRYEGAMYQRDVMRELARQASVTFYGPGFPNFDRDDSLTDVLGKCDVRTDWILVGHSWLGDAPGAPIRRWSPLSLANSPVPVALVLNKEYTNLEAKIDFLRSDRISVCFSHHHEIEHLVERTPAHAVYWPFGFDRSRFWYDAAAKTTDLGFSGILQNPVKGLQDDLRARVMQRLFHCDGDTPLHTHPEFSRFRIEWNAVPRAHPSVAPSTHRFMSDDEYSILVRRCKSFLCTRSPADLVSPRYFECMAAGARIISEPHPGLKRLAIGGLTIDLELDSLHDVLSNALSDSSQAATIALTQTAASEHGWDSRVRTMLEHLVRLADGSRPHSSSLRDTCLGLQTNR